MATSFSVPDPPGGLATLPVIGVLLVLSLLALAASWRAGRSPMVAVPPPLEPGTDRGRCGSPGGRASRQAGKFRRCRLRVPKESTAPVTTRALPMAMRRMVRPVAARLPRPDEFAVLP